MRDGASRWRARRLRRRLGIIALALVSALAVLALILVVLPPPRPEYRPVSLSQAEAEAAYGQLITDDRADASLWPECVPIDLPPQGRRLPVAVIVIFHGYTSCPNQFRRLAEQLSAAGYRVLVPRWPEHGVRDRITEPVPADPQRLADFATRIADIATAFSPRVIVGGLSGGATLALWLGTRRPELERVVLVAPFLSPRIVPTPLSAPAGNVIRYAVNIEIWWDPSRTNQPFVPHYSYAQWSTRSIATLMALAHDARRPSPDASAAFVYLRNASDRQVDDQTIADTIADQRAAGEQVRSYRLPASLQAQHEYVDPNTPHNKVAETYPLLRDLFTSGSTGRLPAE